MRRSESRVPWLVWVGGNQLLCQRCGATPIMPHGCGASALVAYLRALGREHAGCAERPEESKTDA